MRWTPNKVTFLRVAIGFAAVSLFGQSARMNLLAVVLTAISVGLDALDGHLARRRNMESALGAQVDILGDRIVENMYFTYFAVVGMVSLWLPMLFFARGAATDFLRSLATRAGRSGWGTNAMTETWWGRALVGSRWSRGAYAALKCSCFCYLGLELALRQGPVALLGDGAAGSYAAIRAGAQTLAWMTAAFCAVRGIPVLVEGWRYFAGNLGNQTARKATQGDAG
jgi:CDP-diacylglycerol--glycerol-3-phosphate 3-phosphatidyltransferase